MLAGNDKRRGWVFAVVRGWPSVVAVGEVMVSVAEKRKLNKKQSPQAHCSAPTRRRRTCPCLMQRWLEMETKRVVEEEVISSRWNRDWMSR